MYVNPNLYMGRPTEERSPNEMAIYDKLDALGITYHRADHDHADTIQDCLLVEEVLGAKICKNLFLTNRQQTAFYLLMMAGDKPFKTKDLSPLLGCSRLSFAGAEHMARLLGTTPGSASGLEVLFDTDNAVQLVVDAPLLEETYISGHPSISTSTLRIEVGEFIRYVEDLSHKPTVIHLPDPTQQG